MQQKYIEKLNREYSQRMLDLINICNYCNNQDPDVNICPECQMYICNKCQIDHNLITCLCNKKVCAPIYDEYHKANCDTCDKITCRSREERCIKCTRVWVFCQECCNETPQVYRCNKTCYCPNSLTYQNQCGGLSRYVFCSGCMEDTECQVEDCDNKYHHFREIDCAGNETFICCQHYNSYKEQYSCRIL